MALAASTLYGLVIDSNSAEPPAPLTDLIEIIIIEINRFQSVLLADQILVIVNEICV